MISSCIHFSANGLTHSSSWMQQDNTPRFLVFVGHLGWSHNLAIVISSLVNVDAQMSLWLLV